MFIRENDSIPKASPQRTRLAPSPTGALHLGNARTFLANWLLARQNNWIILLRIEDLDGPRIKPHADQQAVADLRWLGLDWDEGPIHQSPRAPIYAQAIQSLLSNGQAYACTCSRKDVERSASAPHADDGAAVYPGTCRGRFASIAEAIASIAASPGASDRAVAIRFAVPNAEISWRDEFDAAIHSYEANRLGDFVIARAAVSPEGSVTYQAAYQLAVVIDDREMGITQVVRGDDLLDSTPRQMLLYRALGWEREIPRYCHLPLVIGADGRRLAKRHGDTRLSYYREHGVSPERVISLLARWLGIEPPARSVTARDLIGRLKLTAIERQPIVFQAEDDRWLRS